MTQHDANHQVGLLTAIRCLTLAKVSLLLTVKDCNQYMESTPQNCYRLFPLTKNKVLFFCDFCNENIYHSNQKFYIKSILNKGFAIIGYIHITEIKNHYHLMKKL